MAKPLLSIETIMEGALALLQDQGAASFSARNLATQLQCSTRTLYEQVGKREALIKQLMIYHFSSTSANFSSANSWQDCAYIWCLGLRKALTQQPQLSLLMTMDHRDAMDHYIKQLFEQLLDHGISKTLAIQICRVLTNLVVNLCRAEIESPDSLLGRVATRSSPAAQKPGSATIDSEAAPTVFTDSVRWMISGISVDEFKAD